MHFDKIIETGREADRFGDWLRCGSGNGDSAQVGRPGDGLGWGRVLSELGRMTYVALGLEVPFAEMGKSREGTDFLGGGRRVRRISRSSRHV